MCIIIDTNCLASVFSKTAENHDEFEPVLEWMLHGKGKLICGGTKYIDELKKTKKYLNIINCLKDKGKVIFADKENVDQEHSRIEKMVNDKDFDDPHLPAIVIVGKSKLICTKDTRSVKFITRTDIYPKGIDIPKYYTGARNIKLLSDKYIYDCYKPLKKCNKSDIENLEKLL